MHQRKLSLRDFISREFYKAALLPLLIIEVTLLVLYFSMNAHILGKSTATLSEDRLSHLQGIVESQAIIISEQLRTVSDIAKILQSQTTRFFNQPNQFPVFGSTPQFDFATNGVYHKLHDNGGSCLFYTDLTLVGSKEKNKAIRTEALDPLFKNILEANHNIVAVYLNTHDSMCRYYPFLKDIHEQLPPHMNITEFNFYYLADKAHNPDRKPVWTKAYLDPMGKGWMMSCIVPIYNNDFLEGVAGIDITIGSFINTLMDLQLPWDSQAFLVDAQGTIMAMPQRVANIFKLTELQEHQYSGQVLQDTPKPDQFNLFKSVLTETTEPVSRLMQQKKGSVQFELDRHPYMLCQATVSEADWKLMVLTDKETILAPVSRMERQTKQVGYSAAGIMVLFTVLFFVYLFTNTRKMSGRIASTVEAMTQAIHRLGTGYYKTSLQPSNVAELDLLSDTFKSMASDLEVLHDSLKEEVNRANAAGNEAREAEERLAEHQLHLEHLVASRTLELTDTNNKLIVGIHRRQKAEKALDLQRLQLLSIFDSIDEPIYVACPDTYEVLFVNETLKRYWSDAIGQKCYEVFQNLTAPCSFCTNKYIFGNNTGKTYNWERFSETSGRWFRCIDKAIQWPDGRMVRYEMAIDITEQKHAANEKKHLVKQLQRAEKMEALGTLAGGVAHDLNNILGGLVGYPDLLLLDLPKDSPLRKPIMTMQTSGRRAAAIVQDLLTLAQRNVPVKEIAQLNNIIEAYLDSPEHERLVSQHQNISFRVEYDQKLLNCKASSIHLSTMIMNLISNAAEAFSDSGMVTISTRNQYLDKPVKGYSEIEKGDYVVLTVKDNGIGISPDDLQRIFEPFFTKKKMGRSGTGLGMSVVWGTVEDHSGYIEVKSMVDSGSTFHIYLPANNEKHAPKKSDASNPSYMGNQETILVVDDEETQRELAVSMLTKFGYTVTAVPGGREAVEYLKQNMVDLIVLDMIMEHNIDGLETYKRILKIHPKQKAIIASGFSKTEALKEAQRLGAGRYVKKPYTYNILNHAVYDELH